MPGLEELLAMQGGGGGQGGPPPPQGGMPPMPPGGGGGDMGGQLAQVLGNLMKDPVALQGMQQFAQQAGIPMPGGGGGGPPPGPPMPQGGPPPGAPMPQGGIPPGGELDMVNQAMDQAGATWDGQEAPTQNDIERLMAEPTDTNVESFDAQFGEGMAAKYLGESEGGQGPAPKEGNDNDQDDQDDDY